MNDTYAAENMYDAWDNGDRHEIRKRFSRLEELTRMARESGLWDKVGFPKELERFAALVAAAERREWVGLEQSDMPDGEDPIYDDPRFIAGIVWAAKKLLEKNT